MPTRFYFGSGGSPVNSPPFSAEWEHTDQAVLRLLNSPKQSDFMSALGPTAYDGVDHLVDADACLFQGVSDRLAAQVIPAQTLKLQIRCVEVNADNNLFVAWKVFLVDSAGAVVPGGTILAIKRDATEMSATAGVNRGDSATSTEVTAIAGDRICLELGGGGLPVAAAGVNGHDLTMEFGDAAADLPEDDTTAVEGAGWLEFATTLRGSTPSMLTLTGAG